MIDGVMLDEDGDHALTLSGASDHLFLVADGMGGHSGGRLASTMACTGLAKAWAADHNGLDLVRALHASNRALYVAIAMSPELSGMGTTIAGAHIIGPTFRWFNVGDSRIYLYRHGVLTQLSVDHAIGEGDIYPAGTLTQCLGGNTSFIEIDPAIGVTELHPSDTVLICTDGVSAVLTDEQIAHACAASSLAQLSGELRSAVRACGAPDNFSYIAVRS